eukprot:gene11259-15065_t
MTIQAAHPFLFEHRSAPGLLQRAAALAWSLVGALISLRDDAETPPLIMPMARSAEADAAPQVSQEALDRFQTIIVPLLDSAYNFARFLCRDADAASDIVQDAFLRAYRGFEGFRGGDPRAWMFAIVRNCHRAWQAEGRRKSRFEVSMTAAGDGDDMEPPAFQIASDADTPEDETIQKSQSVRVRQVVSGLAEPLREILV